MHFISSFSSMGGYHQQQQQQQNRSSSSSNFQNYNRQQDQVRDSPICKNYS
jgi:hypothetical protein